MHQIQGPLQVNVGVQYIYSVVPADGITYTWTVTGCDILTGQGTASITVLWTLVGQGSIQVDVSNGAGDNLVIIDPTGA